MEFLERKLHFQTYKFERRELTVMCNFAFNYTQYILQCRGDLQNFYINNDISAQLTGSKCQSK